MKPTKRNNVRAVKDEWLVFLYDEVLLYCENDNVDFSGYNLTTNPFLKPLQNREGFTIVNKMKEARLGQIDTIFFSPNGGKIKSFFTHLRNAIAHNRLFLNNDNKLIVEDQYQGWLTMYAEISSFEKLKKIITEIKKNYKK